MSLLVRLGEQGQAGRAAAAAGSGLGVVKPEPNHLPEPDKENECHLECRLCHSFDIDGIV